MGHSSEPCKNGWTDRDAVLWTALGPRNHVLDGVQIPHVKGQFWGGKGGPLWSIGTLRRELYKNGWTDRDAVKDVNSCRPREACFRWGCTWCNLANTTESSICGDDAAFLSNYFQYLLLSSSSSSSRYYYFARGNGCELLWWTDRQTDRRESVTDRQTGVCLSVCPTGYLRNHTRDLYQFLCAYCPCPWLGSPPARWR